MNTRSDSSSIVVLIDADNTKLSAIPAILEEIAKFGATSVRRAYGDWSSSNLNGWKRVMLDHSIQPVQQFAYTTGKNASDIAMIIQAMDLMHSGRFDGFCLVSSDSDFTPLAMRLREQTLNVYGFGEKKTPKPFVESCDKFTYIELLGEDDPSGASEVKPANDPRLFNLFKNAIDAIGDDNGWASLGGVGSHINKQSSDFDPRMWGATKLSDLAEAIPKVEVKRSDAKVQVKIIQAKKKAAKKAGQKRGN